MSSSATGDEPAEQGSVLPTNASSCCLTGGLHCNAFPRGSKGDEAVVAACLRSDGPHAAVTRAPLGARPPHWGPAPRTGGPLHWAPPDPGLSTS
ncbi:unnamed protein product [Boreogadus saida]